MNGNQCDRAATHQVIANEQHQFVVWPTRHRLPSGWHYLGKEGSRSELDAYLRQMAVETVPTPLLVTDRRALDTQWD